MHNFSIELDVDKSSPQFDCKKSLAKWAKLSLDTEAWKDGIVFVDGSVKYHIDNPELFYKLMETE